MQSTAEQLDDILASVNNLRTTQSNLQAQIETLSGNVDTANTYAKVRPATPSRSALNLLGKENHGCTMR